jgi:hypothetical protein
LRDATKFVGTDILAELVSLSKPCEIDLADCIEEEALLLALDANVVAKGLTGMVTVDSAMCLSFIEEETEICRDGMRADSYSDDNGGYGNNGGYGGAAYSRQTIFPNSISIILCIWFTLKMLF